MKSQTAVLLELGLSLALTGCGTIPATKTALPHHRGVKKSTGHGHHA
jgi:hypothetical protein